MPSSNPAGGKMEYNIKNKLNIGIEKWLFFEYSVNSDLKIYKFQERLEMAVKPAQAQILGLDLNLPLHQSTV